MFFPLPPRLMLANALLNQDSLFISRALWCKGGERERESCTERCPWLSGSSACHMLLLPHASQASWNIGQSRRIRHVRYSQVYWPRGHVQSQRTRWYTHIAHTLCMCTCTHTCFLGRDIKQGFPGEHPLMTMFPKAWFKLRSFSCTFTNTFLLWVS